MKRTWLVLLLIAGLLLGGCKAKAEPPAVEENVQSNANSGCYFGTCIKDAYAFVDEEYFIILFDITPIEGITNANTAPQFTTPITLKAVGTDGTEYLNNIYTQEEYYCYVGQDVPWAFGQLAAICGIGTPNTVNAIVPAVGDTIIVTLPEFGNYQVELEVGNQL